jgi:hypothetical protein
MVHLIDEYILKDELFDIQYLFSNILFHALDYMHRFCANDP